MGKIKDDLDFESKKNYRIDAGQDTPYGRLSYRVLTKNGNSYGFYDNGESGEDIQETTSGKSVEAVGNKIKKSKTALEDPLVPAKVINAKHGDIILNAEDGNIILKGDNILIEANGTRDDGDGDILIKANKGIRLDAPDLRLDTDQLRMMAKKDFTLVGKAYGEIIAGFLTVGSAADFGGSSLLNKITSIAKNFLGF